MLAGTLDRRIDIQRATVTLDGFGGESRTWATIGNLWASMTPISDGERFRSDERAADITTRFVVRWSSLTSTVDAKDRLIFDGRTFEIYGVKEIGYRDGVEITAAARGEYVA
jgi:SPP1 family predicted phage head-tail adaptor